MDKNAIKKYAIWARRELIAKVAQKAQQYGITKDNIIDSNADSIRGVLLTNTEKKQRQALIKKIREDGYEQVIEEVAYTWFNRFIALRFMEVNGYLPSHTRVFTNEENEFKPQILTDAISLNLEGLDIEKVYELKEANKEDELYKYLLIVQCNSLSGVLPKMFQKISDYTELLLPDYLLRNGSVIQQMIEMIDEEDWKDTVQIIGWLYQYYNSEKKDEVFAALKKNVKITKENIPAATQLFTPDWIVRYMVENSLGRLWVEGHPDDELKTNWKYYVEEAEQEPEVEEQLSEIRKEYKTLKPEDILCVDPCSGSGHILVYLFDVLMQIYEAYGVDARTAVASIVENNIYGLDIDERAAQLSYFAIMMKACQYDRRFLYRGIQPHVYAIEESNHIQYKNEFGDFLLSEEHRETLRYLLDIFQDAKEYGSILNVEQRDYVGFLDAWEKCADATIEDITMVGWYMEAKDTVVDLANQAIALSQKYHVVVTNPPYMGAGNMNVKLNKFIKEKYADYKSDFFSAFMVHCTEMTAKNGKLGFFTPYVWMFIQSYEKLRNLICEQKTIETLIQFEYSAFEEATVPVCTLVFGNSHFDKKACYFRLTEFKGGMEVQREKTLEAISNHNCGYYYETSSSNFSKIPGSPVAYWVSDNMLRAFEHKTINDIEPPRFGMSTSDNNRFVRMWHEVSYNKFAHPVETMDEVDFSKKWYPYNNGGEFRRWYGDNGDVVNWENDGYEIKGFGRAAIRNKQFYFKSGITWTAISSAKISVRTFEYGYLFSSAGFCIFVEENKKIILALMNNIVGKAILEILSPTINFNVGDIAKLPIIIVDSKKEQINRIVDLNIQISKKDWDSFETSWDFTTHPFIRCKNFKDDEVAEDKMQYITDMNYIEDAYNNWDNECYTRFNQLKSNEEELNRIFIGIYGLQDELTPEVEKRDVTVRLADKSWDVRSFISYAVGCMFGRYSLDADGLIFAGGEWRALQYKTFPADPDNIIPISDDEYFDDDIVSRFVKFLETVYGEASLQDNLKFIADALGGNGQPKEVIRNYFLNDFFADHCKTYQKRPIYWLFDSGKKNGFKCLIYMHRYKPDTIARIRTDYVHEQQARYRTEIADLENRIANAATSERVKLNKELKLRNEQAAELHVYEEKIHHLADQMISIDLDDGVKVNYEKFKDVLAKIK